MIIQPKLRSFVCTTSHPEGCTQNVQHQIDYVKKQKKLEGPKNVLIIGASTGFGLASRIVSTFGAESNTIGVFLEKPATPKRTASAGWYNTAAFEKAAHDQGYYAKSINGDAFSTEIKEQTIKLIKQDLDKIDLVIYSLASPRRIHPVTGEKFSSVLKPIGKKFDSQTVDFHSGQISKVSIEPATEEEICETKAVMGGEDWEMWIEALLQADVLSEKAATVAYSYIGPKITYPVYREGTIGKAKEHLESTAKKIHNLMTSIHGTAFVSVNKALVTQASSAIPVVPLYISLLYKVMKHKRLHEGCIEQIYRLFSERLYQDEVLVDNQGRIRVDDWELRDDVQEEVLSSWKKITTDNLTQFSDIEGYRAEFFHLFGFGFDTIDYNEDVDPEVLIPSIKK